MLKYSFVYIFVCSLICLGSCVLYRECEEIEVDTYVANVQNCQQYIYCNGESSFLSECPPDHYFNETEAVCKEFYDGIRCVNNLNDISSSSSSTSIKFTTITSSAPTQLSDFLISNPIVGRPKCQPHGQETFVHPLRCEYYYKCVRGFLTIFHCNFNYGWHQERQLCVPFHETKCKQVAT